MVLLVVATSTLTWWITEPRPAFAEADALDMVGLKVVKVLPEELQTSALILPQQLAVRIQQRQHSVVVR
jgi:regulatory protein YycH of two-component signal transduction system YycFG